MHRISQRRGSLRRLRCLVRTCHSTDLWDGCPSWIAFVKDCTLLFRAIKACTSVVVNVGMYGNALTRHLIVPHKLAAFANFRPMSGIIVRHQLQMTGFYNDPGLAV